MPLPREFYAQETTALARALLGKRLVRVWRGRRLSGLIVETEAYLGPRDSACHTWKHRRTPRVRSMYLPGGHAYVYLIYGLHSCFNVVAEGEGEAVLVRALDPDPGLLGGASRRAEGRRGLSPRTDGPGRLCQALRISKALDGQTLSGKMIFIEDAGVAPEPEDIGYGPRIGVDYAKEGGAAEWPLRFFWRGNPFVSRKEKGWKDASPLIRPSGPIT